MCVSPPTYSLLLSCTHLSDDPGRYLCIAQQASAFTAWDCLAAEAEVHGLAPLVYTRLQAAGVSLPLAVKRELQGLTVRHRLANQIRMQVLAEILTTFEAAGISALVLKGAALSQLLYPHPGLRPMRDLDLLIKKAEARHAQNLLAELGFIAPAPAASNLPDKHLPAAIRQIEGVSVSVELHHNLFNNDYHVSMTFEQVSDTALCFRLSGTPAYTLGYEEMLWHLCEHVTYHATIWEPIRLIWVADVVGFAERFVNEINWSRLAYHYPHALKVLSLFHFMTPLSETLRRRAGLKSVKALAGTGQEFDGWPRLSLAAQRDKGFRRILCDTFFPSAWWLRLHYRLDAGQPLFWYRWVVHPWRIVTWAGRYLRDRLQSK